MYIYIYIYIYQQSPFLPIELKDGRLDAVRCLCEAGADKELSLSLYIYIYIRHHVIIHNNA